MKVKVTYWNDNLFNAVIVIIIIEVLSTVLKRETTSSVDSLYRN